MDIEGLEVKVTGRRNKSITYWKNGVIIGRKCTMCGEDKEISEFSLYRKGGKNYKAECKRCSSIRKGHKAQKYFDDKKGVEVRIEKGCTTYWKNGTIVGRKCTTCGKDKEISEFTFRKERGFYKSKCKECEREKQRKRCKSKKEKEEKKDVVINEKGLEVRGSEYDSRSVTYWKDGILVGIKCTGCGEDKDISEFYIANKERGTYDPKCKKCKAEKDKIRRRKKLYSILPDSVIEMANEKGWGVKIQKNTKEGFSYWENGIMVAKRCTKCGKDKDVSEFNFHDKERGTYESKCKECEKKYREENKEYIHKRSKEYRRKNAEKISEKGKENYKKMKERNLKLISNLLEQINPLFRELNLPVYGYIYKFENIKTGKVYIGQTINALKKRYCVDIKKDWIQERLRTDTQKFKEELIEEDIIVTELFDVAFCQYHLDKLEAYWINYYDSYNNGYNNTAGNYITDDGIEEFNQILSDHNLEFIDGKLVKIA